MIRSQLLKLVDHVQVRLKGLHIRQIAGRGRDGLWDVLDGLLLAEELFGDAHALRQLSRHRLVIRRETQRIEADIQHHVKHHAEDQGEHHPPLQRPIITRAIHRTRRGGPFRRVGQGGHSGRGGFEAEIITPTWECTSQVEIDRDIAGSTFVSSSHTPPTP